MKCFICAEGILTQKCDHLLRESNGKCKEVPLLYYVCDHCECETLDDELSIVNKENMQKFYEETK